MSVTWEGQLLLFLQAHRSPFWDDLFSRFTHLGDAGLVFITVGVLLLLFRPTRRAGGTVLLALLIGLLITNVTLKPLVSRMRPFLDVPGLLPLVTENDSHSFPSGHACAAFAFASALWHTLPVRWGKRLAVAFAALMAFSRLYVGVHYPTDVLAGVLVGVLSGVLAHALLQHLPSRKSN